MLETCLPKWNQICEAVCIVPYLSGLLFFHLWNDGFFEHMNLWIIFSFNQCIHFGVHYYCVLPWLNGVFLRFMGGYLIFPIVPISTSILLCYRHSNDHMHLLFLKNLFHQFTVKDRNDKWPSQKLPTPKQLYLHTINIPLLWNIFRKYDSLFTYNFYKLANLNNIVHTEFYYAFTMNS